MAERRMFAKTIIDSDSFLDMPLSTQALYFHLSMRADDEGFVNNPKKIARMIGADDDSLRILVSKQYLIPFESGVVVIKHWKIHNYIRGDRLTETSCKQEKSMLSIDENGAYSILDDIKEIQALDSGDKRKLAYQNSTLPYSFTYKMKRAFEGKTCPLCGCTMSSSIKRAMPTIQHNKPISDGGEHELHNISVICLSCNTSIQNQETGELNNSEVIEMWDKIVYADKHKINWFFDLSLLENVYKEGMSDACQTSDGQVTDKCLTQDRLGKDRLGKDRLELGKVIEKTTSSLSTGVDPAPKISATEVVNLYHEICISYPKVRSMSDNRRKAINARLRTHSMDEVREVFEKAERSSFLKGSNKRNWSANFDWLMNDANFCKVLDGNYDDKQSGGNNGGLTDEELEIWGNIGTNL